MAMDAHCHAEVVRMDGVSLLSGLLRDGSGVEKVVAATAMQHLAQFGHHDAIGEAGSILALVNHARDGGDAQRKAATRALRTLSEHEGSRRRILAADGLALIIGRLQTPPSRRSVNGEGADSSIICGGQSVEHAALLDASAAIALLNDDNGTESEIQAVVMVIIEQSATEAGARQIVDGGGVPVLTSRLHVREDLHTTEVVNALQNLCVRASASRDVAAAGAVPPLVELLRDDCARIEALLLLEALSDVDTQTRSQIVQAGAVPTLVLLLQSDNLAAKLSTAVNLNRLSDESAFKGVIVAAGAVKPLIKLAGSDKSDLQAPAITTLTLLACQDTIRLGIVQESGIAVFCIDAIRETRDGIFGEKSAPTCAAFGCGVCKGPPKRRDLGSARSCALGRRRYQVECSPHAERTLRQRVQQGTVR
jgi:hypothetical protein